MILFCELATTPVLLAGLPTLLSKDRTNWSDREQHLACLSSLAEHVVYVHLRLLFMALFLPDLEGIDRRNRTNSHVTEEEERVGKRVSVDHFGDGGSTTASCG